MNVYRCGLWPQTVNHRTEARDRKEAREIYARSFPYPVEPSLVYVNDGENEDADC